MNNLEKCCCHMFAHVVLLNFFWWAGDGEERWVIGVYDDMDDVEDVVVIDYCPFCGAKLENINGSENA